MSSSANPPTSTSFTHYQGESPTPTSRLAHVESIFSYLMRVALAVLVIWILSLPALALLSYFGYFQLFSRILPRIQLGDTRLGGMSTYDAAVHLNKAWNMEREIVAGAVIAGEIQTWDLAPAALGLSLDPILTAQLAYDVGHGQNPLAELDQFLKSLFGGWQVEPVVIFDPQAALVGLENLSAQVTLPARDATFYLDAGQLTAVPGQAGITIDLERTIEVLSANPAAVLVDGYILLEMKTIPPAITDVSAEMADAQRLLETKVNINAYDPISDEHFNWQVPQDIVKSWVSLEYTGAGTHASIAEQHVLSYLDTLSQSLGADRYLATPEQSNLLASAVENGEPIQLTVKHPATTYLIQPGDTLLKLAWYQGIPFWMILEANPDLDANNLVAGQTITIPSKDDLLPLPVIPNKRIVISISQQHLWAYQDGALLADYVISTGIDRSPTQPGVFQVQTHDPNAYASVWDLYMPNFLGIYEAWPGFLNGLHGLPTLSSGRQLWRDVLGRPASYGCIILDIPASEFLYTWAEDGVVVTIQP